MRKNYSKVVLLVDRSGSMSDWLNDAQSLVNNFIKDQLTNMENFEINFTLWDFDNFPRKMINGNFNKESTNIPSYDLKPSGGTALYDAMHEVITRTGEELACMKEEDRPEKVVFVTLTDGEENSSRKFTSNQVKALVKQQESVYSWEFVYLGANQDSYITGNSLGFKTSNVADYTMDSYANTAKCTSDMLKRYTRGLSPIGYTQEEKEKMK